MQKWFFMLSTENRQHLEDLILDHEGYRQFPYQDSVGKLTIGIGRNLDSVGLALFEAKYLMQNDIAKCEDALNKLPFYSHLSDVRKIVLIDMCFNLGFKKLLDFEKTINAINDRNYKLASEEMLKSKWAWQVKNRALELSKMMESGTFI